MKPFPLALALVAIVACGGGRQETCFGFFGECPGTPCTSWSSRVSPGRRICTGGASCPGFVEPTPDFGLEPPQIHMRVSEKLSLQGYPYDRRPEGCSSGGYPMWLGWRATVPGAIEFQGFAASSAEAVAIAPGATQILAEGMPRPDGVATLPVVVCRPTSPPGGCDEVAVTIHVVP